jgi:hypothetical protein
VNKVIIATVEFMTLNEIRYTLQHQFFVSSWLRFQPLKNSHAQHMLLLVESPGKYTHSKQVKVVYYWIEKES